MGDDAGFYGRERGGEVKHRFDRTTFAIAHRLRICYSLISKAMLAWGLVDIGGGFL